MAAACDVAEADSFCAVCVCARRLSRSLKLFYISIDLEKIERALLLELQDEFSELGDGILEVLAVVF